MTENRATNITWHSSQVSRGDRERILGQKGCTLWFTGLPSSGKSTTAFALEHRIAEYGYLAYVLDGDNIRHGLNKNLGFTASDREENIRRIGEVAKLFADAGFVCITSFISPYARERDLVRKLHRDAGLGFMEIYVDTPIQVCEARDPKGLYGKARRGELKGFTGVDDPYEAPHSAELIITAETRTPEDLATLILQYGMELGLFSFLKKALPEEEPLILKGLPQTGPAPVIRPAP